jgi:1-acyl-sn-glycerol-3-phosphate acyltransferase
MPPPLPTAVPRRGGPLTRALGRLALNVLGWRIEGTIPNRSKLVVIAAPHRSNWDFAVGLAAKFALGIDATFLGKHTLFRWPWGMLFRHWGGIPVDRSAPHDTVSLVAARFSAQDRLVLAIAPEGTRTPGKPWKSGFWHIAHAAGVPIVPIAFDWSDRVLRILPMFETMDLESDMERIQHMYAGIRGHGM